MNEPLPIVLLHGVGLDRSMWEPFREEWERIGTTPAVALDLPGHGQRPPFSGPVTLAEMADDVAGRLPGRYHLVGFSLGALIAQHLARYRPDLVASLVSVSSVCRRTKPEAAAVQGRLRNAQSDFPSSVEASIHCWFPEGSAVSTRLTEHTRNTLLKNRADSYLHAYHVFATGDAEIGPELDGIRVPFLAITGELDPGSTPEMNRRLSEAIPGARLVVLPETRHMLPVERPAELADLVHQFTEQPNRENHD